MLVPHDNQHVKSVQVTSRGIRALISLLLVGTLLIGTVTVGVFLKGSDGVHAMRLERENVLLASEVEQMQQQVETLTESIEVLSDKEEKYRTIAGLEEIGPDVRRVGIGGPGTEMPGSGKLYKLDSELGEKVFNASYDLNTLLRRADLLGTSMDEALLVLEANVERLEATPSIAPSDGHLSSLFDPRRRHPVLKITRPHEGIDIAAPVGEPILAPAAGTVRFAGTKRGGYGKVVEINHGHGYVTRFAHASKILARKGQTVERGEIIAEVGATGLVSGPHLHYEIEVNGKPVDPLNFIIEDAIPD